jgi:hypothetical protein
MAKKAVKKAGKKAGAKKAAKPTFRLTASANDAEKRDYSKVDAEHTDADKKRWVMIKQRGNWSFQKAAAPAATAPQTICHYDPNTGTWTDCYDVT